MLPRSCLRLADSKSNSSTRWPRRTTTRVSSGCVASISILLAIEQSLANRLAHGSCFSPSQRCRAGPEAGLTKGIGAGAVSTRGRRLDQSDVAVRRCIALSGMGIDLDVESQHDLLARYGGGGAHGASAGVLG